MNQLLSIYYRLLPKALEVEDKVTMYNTRNIVHNNYTATLYFLDIFFCCNGLTVYYWGIVPWWSYTFICSYFTTYSWNKTICRIEIVHFISEQLIYPDDNILTQHYPFGFLNIVLSKLHGLTFLVKTKFRWNLNVRNFIFCVLKGLKLWRHLFD